MLSFFKYLLRQQVPVLDLASPPSTLIYSERFARLFWELALAPAGISICNHPETEFMTTMTTPPQVDKEKQSVGVATGAL